MSKKISILVYLSISIAVIFWGISFVWTNELLNSGIRPYTIVLLRLLFASVILFSISLGAKKLEKIRKQDIKWFLLMVTFEPFLYFIGETIGIQKVNSPTLSSIIIATIPIFASIAGLFILKERLTLINFIGIFITVPGILLVVMNNDNISVEHYTGILLLFIAVIAAVLYSIIVRRLADNYNSYTIVTYQHSIGVLYFLPLFLIFDLKYFDISLIGLKQISYIFSLALFCSSIAFILFIKSIKILGVARANIFTSIVPAISAIAAYFISNESITPNKIAGILVVIMGVIIAQREKKKSV